MSFTMAANTGIAARSETLEVMGQAVRIRQAGTGGAAQLPGDYDGDVKSDLAVWRPSSGVWYVLTSSSNYTTFLSQGWGVATDIPVPGDYDGDGKVDLAAWRPSSGVWYVLTSSSNYTTFLNKDWGAQSLGDIPVVDPLTLLRQRGVLS
jgi:hypothetical protein